MVPLQPTSSSSIQPSATVPVPPRPRSSLLDTDKAKEYVVQQLNLSSTDSLKDFEKHVSVSVMVAGKAYYTIDKLETNLNKFKTATSSSSSSVATVAASATSSDTTIRRENVPCYTTVQAAQYLQMEPEAFKKLNLQPDLRLTKQVNDPDRFLQDTLDRRIPKSDKPIPEVLVREEIATYLGLSAVQVDRLTKKISPDYLRVGKPEKYYLKATLDSIPLSKRDCPSGLTVSTKSCKAEVVESEKVKTEQCMTAETIINHLKVSERVFAKMVEKNKIYPDLHGFNCKRTKGVQPRLLFLASTENTFTQTNGKHLDKFKLPNNGMFSDEEYNLLKTAPEKTPVTVFYGPGASEWLALDKSSFDHLRDKKNKKGPKLTANYETAGTKVNRPFYTKENLMAFKEKLEAWKSANSSSIPTLMKNPSKPATTSSSSIAQTATTSTSSSMAQTATSFVREQRLECDSYTSLESEERLNISRILIEKIVKFGKMKPDVAGYNTTNPKEEKPHDLFLKETADTFKRDNADHLSLFQRGHSILIQRKDYELLKRASDKDKQVVKAYHGKAAAAILNTTSSLFERAIKKGSPIKADFIVRGIKDRYIKSYYTEETLLKYKPKLAAYLDKKGLSHDAAPQKGKKEETDGSAITSTTSSSSQPSPKKGDKRKYTETATQVEETTAPLSTSPEPLIGPLTPTSTLTDVFDPMNISLHDSPPPAPVIANSPSTARLLGPPSLVGTDYKATSSSTLDSDPLHADFLADDDEPPSKRQKLGIII